jgi:hypothetical protein
MRQGRTLGVFLGVFFALGVVNASAQMWARHPLPAAGACFYEDRDFRGQYFCARLGSNVAMVPYGANDQISSIRIFGDAEVTVYRGAGFSGMSRRFDNDVRNLSGTGWNDRITSYRVGSRGYSHGGNWGGAYGGGGYGGGGYGGWRPDWGYSPTPASGACFYEDKNYRGPYFCQRIGASQSHVPYGANNQISSIRVFGNAEVTVYREMGFRGMSRRFSRDVSNLSGTGWNDQITSFQITNRGYGDGGYGGGNSGGGNYGGGAYGGGSWGGTSSGHWGGGGGRLSYRDAEQIVARAYRSVFGREPDPGARPWIDQVMRNNWSQSELERELRKSPEYRNRR